MSDEIAAVAQALEPTIVAAIRELYAKYGETPLEAADHIQAIIMSSVSGRAEYASLYDRSLSNPRLFEDLASSKMNTEVADRWNTTEVAVRRARRKLRDQGIILRP